MKVKSGRTNKNALILQTWYRRVLAVQELKERKAIKQRREDMKEMQIMMVS